MRLIAIAVLAAAFVITGTAFAETDSPAPPEQQSATDTGARLASYMRQAATAYQTGDHEAWVRALEQVHQLRPHNQDVMRQLVMGYSLLEDLHLAFNMMLKMQQQGLAEDWDEIDEVAIMRPHRLYEHLNTLMTEAGQPFGDAEVFTRLDGLVRMPETLAHDPASGRFFVGTVREGLILASTDGEDWQPFASPETVDGLMSVFSLAVDAERGHLWVATGMIAQFRQFDADQAGRTGLLKLDLQSGELIETYWVDAGGQPSVLGSIALASDGTVYAADTVRPIIFRLKPGDAAPAPFFAHQVLTSLRGITLSGDDRLLYMADYDMGIFIAETDGDSAWKLAVPETLNESGIDGLYWWDHHLVAIQNNISPQRVLRLQLGEDGLGVTAVAPLLSAQPEFDVPTYGTIVDNDLYFLASSHWQSVDNRGRPLRRLPETPIMRTAIDTTEVLVVGADMLERMRREAEEAERREREARGEFDEDELWPVPRIFPDGR